MRLACAPASGAHIDALLNRCERPESLPPGPPGVSRSIFPGFMSGCRFTETRFRQLLTTHTPSGVLAPSVRYLRNCRIPSLCRRLGQPATTPDTD